MLPSDDPNQIYDDFSGDLARNRPPPGLYNSDDDEDKESDFGEPPSDGILAVESDGLLHQYNEEFAEEQRVLAPQNSLVASGDNDWWCWPSKQVNLQECLLDLMSGFPRTCFSEKELNATRWYAKKNGVSLQPTIKQVKNHCQSILNVAGLETKLIDGKLGNSFAVNDWFKILEHEFANSLIRPKLHLYPEDSGDRLEEGRQAAKWKEEVDGNISGLMARGNGGKDYHIEEVCFAKLNNAGAIGPVMPMRWFTRNGRLLSIAHQLHLTPSRSAFIIDGRAAACIEIPLKNYFLNILDLEEPDCQSRYDVPPPSSISGVLHDPALPLDPWEQPTVNRWCLKAKGHRVHSVPLWTHCDDTSGNVSKKWNNHNSILFTLAGLPRALTQMLYNIHFIATSNLSPPLEMIEAVTAMLREARDDGIQVWDCEYNEWILILPWFLAFQGDNPMSSEFASHVGMKGKFFCRICKAKSDKNNRAPGHAGEIDRLTEFMTAGTPRSKNQTIANLTAQLKRAIDGAPSTVDDMATESGSKDKYFQHFLDKLQAAASKLRDEQKERGTDFDANSDTPVEILHIVLLSVVKYWWRDAVSRQMSKGKEELKARLLSVDVAGLNTPPVRGHTYVQYAGSLVALVVLHGLIPDAHYQGWVALCNLAPLMFQPVIEHLPTYLERLKNAVLDFLTATALWNTQWFNKPKFHLFVHLVEHIRRFGPLILYATESFESFNLVIHLCSIHSTKHAPSVDIATAFSHLHVIRHLVSGGYVLVDEDGNETPPRQAGPEVLALLKDDEFLGFMSMGGLSEESRSGNFYIPLPYEKLKYFRSSHAPSRGITVETSKFVVYRKDGKSCVGRVEEILLKPELEVSLGILISKCKIGPDVLPYGLPACTMQVDERCMIAFEELICAVNVNHNCAANGCQTAPMHQVRQERQRTDLFENEVTHAVQPNDCFLNLAQLRSATDVQQFRSVTRYPGLALAEAIEQAIHNRERLECEAKEAEELKEAERLERAEEREAKAVGRKEKAAKREAAKSARAGNAQSGTQKTGGGKKRKAKDVHQDFAEGREELEYRPQPSKSHTVDKSNK
ncbi:hypothetical protein DFH08DRAFT_944451 [Mycena albidolilacea]|uniref:Transposase n=1 Tax=Mycena albidolilacea TaxID=1033008 RepID=A0AAD6Z5B8_9AGAR|nr:hypothetical protein DFH08DRAFT_944451 [Mycena albidolilacea]